MRGRISTLTAVLAFAGFGGADSAAAAIGDSKVGDLTYVECIAGDTAAAPCSFLPKATSGGLGSGLSGGYATAISPDGEDLYVGALIDAAVARFSIGAGGALSWGECVSGDTNLGPGSPNSEACALTPTATAGSTKSGMRNIRSIVISEDGKSLYAASPADDSIAGFTRDTSTGELTYLGCLTTEAETTGCTLIPSAANVMDGIDGLAIAPLGEHVYAGSAGGATVLRFARNTSTGILLPDGCVTGDATLPVCTKISGATAVSGGEGSGLKYTYDVEVDPSGEAVYVAAAVDDAVTVLTRDPSDGSLEFDSCYSGRLALAPHCASFQQVSADGADSGFNEVRRLALGPGALYAISLTDTAVLSFSRSAEGAEIEYKGCITGETETGPSGSGACATTTPTTGAGGAGSGLDGPQGLIASADGRSVYVAADSDSAAARLDVTTSGTLTFGGCITGELNSAGPGGSNACTAVPGATASGSDSGFGTVRDPALSLDGASLYMPTFTDDSVLRFSRDLTEPPPVVPPAENSAGGSPGGGDKTPPDTRLGKKPKARVRSAKKRISVKFTFASTEAGSSFECRLGKRAFKPCRSPAKYKLKLGKRRFEVRAIDAAGNTDPTPAVRVVRVIPKKKG